MRSLLLLPLVAALPSPLRLPELTSSQWAKVQTGFSSIQSLSDWSIAKAHDLIHAAQDEIATVHAGDETQDTIWKKLKDDPHSFSRLTGVIDVSGVQ